MCAHEVHSLFSNIQWYKLLEALWTVLPPPEAQNSTFARPPMPLTPMLKGPGKCPAASAIPRRNFFLRNYPHGCSTFFHIDPDYSLTAVKFLGWFWIFQLVLYHCPPFLIERNFECAKLNCVSFSRPHLRITWIRFAHLRPQGSEIREGKGIFVFPQEAHPPSRLSIKIQSKIYTAVIPFPLFFPGDIVFAAMLINVGKFSFAFGGKRDRVFRVHFKSKLERKEVDLIMQCFGRGNSFCLNLNW